MYVIESFLIGYFYFPFRTQSICLAWTISVSSTCLFSHQSTSRQNDRILITDLPNYHLYVPSCLAVCLSRLLSTYIRANVSSRPSIQPTIHLSVLSSFHQTDCLSTCTSVYRSVWPPIAAVLQASGAQDITFSGFLPHAFNHLGYSGPALALAAKLLGWWNRCWTWHSERALTATNSFLYWQLFVFRYRMDFTETACYYALLLRIRKVRHKKRHWVHPVVSRRFLNGQCYKLNEDLRNCRGKFFIYFRMSIESFDKLLVIVGPRIT